MHGPSFFAFRAAWALGLLGIPAAIEPLRKTLETANDENRDTILEALARLGFSPEK
jgi:HEAT repeat protein